MTNSPELTELMELMRRLVPPPARDLLLLTPRQVEYLRGEKGPEYVFEPEYVFDFYQELSGIKFREVPAFSEKICSGKIIQKDRFAEYAPADMVWAEPLGLAEWEMVDRESVVFAVSEMFMEKFSFSNPNLFLGGLYAD